MPSFAFGPDKEHLDVVFADEYKIDGTFITFKRAEKNILSIANARVGVVGELDHNGELQCKPKD